MTKYEEVIKRLHRNEYAPVYLLCGAENYYIDLVCDYIEKNALDEMAREFDQTILYGKDLAGADIAPAIGLARGFAMMGERKVVIVKEAQNVKKWNALDLYLDNPQPSTVLVLCYKYGLPTKKQIDSAKVEAKGGVVMQSNAISDKQVTYWLRDYISQRQQESKEQLHFDPKVPQILSEYIGPNLTALVSAIDKLILGRQPGQVIDMALVERNIGISKDFNVFELQDALIAGDVLKANRITQYFATSKDHPMMKEMPILYSFFQNLMMYHYLPDKTPRVAAMELGISEFRIADYSKAARRYSAMKTFRIIGFFRDTDARLKGINNPSVGEADLWKELIYKILH
ncbi:MAG: DNA polymerase III subunit delta [Paludibacteraceae bacterium]|nr:DNA polymerase III subunit delta [Paludibacteraceae bacterium]